MQFATTPCPSSSLPDAELLWSERLQQRKRATRESQQTRHLAGLRARALQKFGADGCAAQHILATGAVA